MSKLLNNEAYKVVDDNLVFDSKHPIDVKNVTLKADQGALARGTVLSFDETTKTYEKLSSTATNANCIVADAVAEGETVVTVYTSGSFNSNAINTNDVTLDEVTKNKLRELGIYLK
ncbi:hypothetical protein lbkm_0679 [Lachnospiraceae bacterium KM106-2]|nr:hypothetical protein lbkm_0679 [Lachnospiraceae bacterium KM106-2]